MWCDAPTGADTDASETSFRHDGAAIQFMNCQMAATNAMSSSAVATAWNTR